MQKISSILEKKEDFQTFLKKGKKHSEWCKNNGYIRTTFGWMHKDWISEAFKQNWISGSNPMNYKLVVDVEEYSDYVKSGRGSREIKKERHNLNKVRAFFKFLKTKNEQLQTGNTI